MVNHSRIDAFQTDRGTKQLLQAQAEGTAENLRTIPFFDFKPSTSTDSPVVIESTS